MCSMFLAMPKVAKLNTNEKRPEDIAIGARLRAAREAAGLTQAEMAELCGWGSKDSDAGQKLVSSYETGRRGIDFVDAITFAHILNINIGALVDMTVVPVRPKSK